MAPHSHRDCHGLVDLHKCASRRGHEEKHRGKPHTFLRTEVKEKEHFFQSMGLRMKRVRCEDEMSEGSPCKVGKVNIPSDVRLKKCSVVIAGAPCKVCGRWFKCKTDVDQHVALRHGNCFDICSDGDVQVKNVDSETETCKQYSGPFDYALDFQNPKVKAHRHKPAELRLIFKIGCEVVTRKSVKRKHLKYAVNMSTQTEFDVNGEGETAKDNYEAHVVDIDSHMLDNELIASRASNTRTLNPASEYVIENIMLAQNVTYDENRIPNESPDTNNGRSFGSNTPAKLLEKSTNDQRLVLHDIAPNDLRIVGRRTLNKRSPCDKMDSGRKLPAGIENTPVVVSQRTSVTIPTNPTLPERTTEVPSVHSNDAVVEHTTVGTNTSLQQIPRCSPRGLTETQNEKEVSPCQAENLRSNNPLSKRAAESAEVTQSKNSVGSSSVLSTRIAEECIQIDERSSDDDIQEVLRITRAPRDKDSTEINHESPNRVEREMLLWDAIRDMLRMEQQGYHLLEKKKRPSNDDSRSVECDIANDARITNITVERYSPRIKESLATVEDVGCEEITGKFDPSKAAARKLNISVEELNQYGINYYNEESEVTIIEE